MKKIIEENGIFIIYAIVLLIIVTIGVVINEGESIIFIISNYIMVFLLVFLVRKLYLSNIQKDSKNQSKNKIYIFWLLIFLSWIPCFLAYYPVLFNYDVKAQFNNIITGSYTTHHPLIHTLLCKLFFNIGNALNNVNLGFAIYSIMQMLILSYSMAYSLNFIYKKNIKNWLFIIILCWYMFFPANPIMSICMTKDIIFSALFLLSFCYLLEYREMDKTKKNNIIFTIKLVVTLAVMMLFRNNAIYALALMLVYIIIRALFKRKIKDNIIIISGIIISIVLAYALLGLLKSTLNAEDGNKREMLSVPAQQIASVFLKHAGDLDKEECELILKGIDIGNVLLYKSSLADYVKSGINTEIISANKLDYIKLYLKLGLKYPVDYVIAFLKLNNGYWYLGDTTYAHIYDNKGYGDRQGYLLTDMKQVNGVNVVHETKLPIIENLYEQIATNNIQEKVPIISIMFAPSFYIILFSYTIILNKKHEHVQAFNLFWCYLLTILLGPCAIIRYAYPLMLCVPIGIIYIKVLNSRN